MPVNALELFLPRDVASPIFFGAAFCAVLGGAAMWLRAAFVSIPFPVPNPAVQSPRTAHHHCPSLAVCTAA
jgi:hypothetical protein